MKWRLSWSGVATGIVIFAMWVGIDGWYPKINVGGGVWNPHLHFGSTAAWVFIVIRIVGSTLIVPLLEEVFFRSFLYRYITNPDFQSVPLGLFRWTPFLVTSAVFALEHSQWLAGLLCGFAYQGLVCRTGRLGDAITAHAVTNLLLGLWVILKGAWNFW
jgi:CAAX prenyl protease-like protein